MNPQLISSQLSSVVHALEPLVAALESRVNPQAAAGLNSTLSAIETQVASPTPLTKAQIVQVEAFAEEILTVAAGLPLPPPASTYLKIASMVVPMAFSIINALVPGA